MTNFDIERIVKFNRRQSNIFSKSAKGTSNFAVSLKCEKEKKTFLKSQDHGQTRHKEKDRRQHAAKWVNVE